MKSVLTVILFYISMIAYSQDYTSLNMDKMNSRGSLKTTDYMIGKPLPPSELKGSYHLYDEFYIGGVLLKDNRKILNYPLKLDIYNYSIEVDDDGTIKDLPGVRINAFWWYNENLNLDQKFVNCDQYTIDDTNLVGFFEMLDSGKYQLLIRPKLTIKQPTYVEGLNMGERDSKFLKKTDIYIANSKNELLELSKKNLKDNNFFDVDNKKVNAYLKENKLNVNNIEDVQTFINYLNR